MRRLAISAVGLLILLPVASAQASITLGQTSPTGSTPQNCGPSSGGYIQPTVTSGTTYVVPAAGRITSWSTTALGTSGQQLTLLIVRPLGGSSYLGVTRDGPHLLTPSAKNTFATALNVKAGDILGLDSFNTNFPTACGFVVPGELELGSFPDPPPDDGESGTFTPNTGNRLNASAVFDPSNSFSFAGTSRNKKKGQATVTVNLPGPGTVSLAGKGLKAQAATLAIAAGGSLALPVIGKGKVAKKIRARGKAAVTPSLTFTPVGGSANTQSQPLKLIKKR
jgi:hypothetical protein